MGRQIGGIIAAIVVIGSLTSAQVIVRPRGLGESLGVLSELAEPMYALAKQAHAEGRLGQTRMTLIQGYYEAWQDAMRQAQVAKSPQAREQQHWIAGAALGQMLQLLNE